MPVPRYGNQQYEASDTMPDAFLFLSAHLHEIGAKCTGCTAGNLDFALLSQIEEELAIDFIFRQFSGLVVPV